MSSTPTCKHPPSTDRPPEDGDRAWDFFLSNYYPSRRRRRREAARTVVRTGVGLVAFAVAAAVSLHFGVPLYYGARLWLLEETTLTPAELREDVELLREALYSRHPRPFQFTARQELDRLFDALATTQEPVSKRDFYRRAAPVVAAVRCGHTVLVPEPAFVSSFLGGGRVLPMRAVISGDGRLFVSQVYSDQAAPLLGVEIVAVNGTGAREIRDTLLATQSRDGLNPAFAAYKLNDLFPFLYYVHIEKSDRFVVRVRPRGEPRTVAEHRVAAEPARRVADEYRRQNPGRNYFETRHRPETIVSSRQRAAYLGIPSFQATSRDRDALERFFRTLERDAVESLVIDLRGNTGGGPLLATDLLSYLLREPFRYLDASDDAVDMFTDFGYETYYHPMDPSPVLGFRGDVYVLIDGGSFSQTGQVASMLAAAGTATFVGEESGGGFSCNDNSTLVDLPHSGFRLKLARTGFETSARHLPRGRGILPDVAIRPTVDDLVAGRDPVLEWIDQRLGTDFGSRRTG